ncbi:MAG: hypothetical protein JOZ72_02775 [Alphaproteobacteria bacterium]|nr:hypothetical protein [Alphaproteobacteria bacterium]
MRAAVLCIAASLAFASPAFAKNDLSPADLAALKSYSLSMDKVTAMQAAMDDAHKMPGMDKQMHGAEDSKSIAEMEARMSAMPGAMALFKKHGLTAHDVVVMPFALMDAGMCVLYPSAAPKLADRVSPAQIAFYKQHKAELDKVHWLNGGGE